MRILLAVDGSQCSEVAMDRLREFFPVADVDVLSVVRPPIPAPIAPGWAGGAPVLAEMRIEEDLAQGAIDVAKGKFAGEPNVNYHIATGDPGATIVQVAADRASDVIMVGSHGRGPLERLLVGSVATYVMNHAPCPVLVIKSKKAQPA